MPRVTYVKSARQRYEMVPVIDPVTGRQATTETSRKTRAKPGRPSRPVVQRLTEPDLTKPLPLHTCDFCREPIAVGTSYKWIAPRTGPYGGRKMYRHANHPNWQPWEYSSSLGAQLAQIAWNFDQAVDSAESPEDVQSALEDAAGEIEEIADAKQESAENMESGFEHATEQSDALADIASQLRDWADEVRGADVPALPDPDDADCETCDGTGKLVKMYDDSPLEPWRPGSYAEGVVRECGDCKGTGHPEEVTEQQMDDWREEVRADVTIVDEVPV